MMTAPDDATETESAEGQDGDGRVSSATLAGKVLCGYQAWFNAEGDGAGAGWRHYFHAGSAFEPSFDLWPDVAELGEDELHESPLRMPAPDGAVGHRAYCTLTTAPQNPARYLPGSFKTVCVAARYLPGSFETVMWQF